MKGAGSPFNFYLAADLHSGVILTVMINLLSFGTELDHFRA